MSELSLRDRINLAWHRVTSCWWGNHYWQFHYRGRGINRRKYRGCECCLKIQAFGELSKNWENV